MTLTELLGALSGVLDQIGIPYMIVGSLASAFHGEPRATQDVDVVIDPSIAQLDELMRSFDRASFYVGDGRTALVRRGMFNVVDTTSGWKVDFIIRKDREFSVVELARRLEAQVLGVRVRIAAPEDTVLTKLEWSLISGSDRQVSDAAAIIAVGGADLDWGHLRAWAHHLGVDDLLRRAEAEAAGEPPG